MSEHLTEQETELYRRRSVDPAERRRLHDHLNTCESCLQRVLDPEYSDVAFTALTEAFLPTAQEAPFHLSREEVKNYVRGSIDEADRIICESHLDICEECGEEARTLSAYAAQPVSTASAARRRGKAASFKERFSSWWQLPGLASAPAQALGLIVVFVGLLLLGVIWYQSRNGRTPTQTAQTASSKDENSSAPRKDSTEVKKGDEGGAGPAVSQSEVEQPAPAVSEGQGTQEKNNNSSIVVTLKDNGQEITLDDQGKLTGLDGLPPSTERTLRAVLSGESLPKPVGLDELSSAPITLMGQSAAASAFKVLGPTGVVIANDRPTLRWRPLSGATGYRVSVFDADFNRIARSEQQAATEWRVSSPLRRGMIYSWEVTALKDGQEITAPASPAPRAQFKILEAERLEELSSLEKQRPVSHLTMGVMYARAGLLDEAEREFQRLLRENPRSTLARNLLRTVQAWKNR